MSMFSNEFALRALVCALIVGGCAPTLGTYLVQRRMSLIGDGIGHVALTGVGVGLLLHTSPVTMAVVVAAACAVGLELLRERGRTPGDLALAVLFYGGIAGGVLLIGLASNEGGSGSLNQYLFGSLATTSNRDMVQMAVVGGVLVALMLLLRPALFAVCHDEEYARVAGLPVRTLNMLIAVTTAATVTVGMRTVGLLLVSALMVVPVATAQQVTRGFRSTLLLAMAIGLVVAGAGSTISWQYANTPTGATIVLVAVALFVLTTVATAVLRLRDRRRSILPAAAAATAGDA